MENLVLIFGPVDGKHGQLQISIYEVLSYENLSVLEEVMHSN